MIPAAFAGLNPRYALYCVAHGYATPADAQRADGNMTGFLVWNGERVAQYKRETRRDFIDADYDRWLYDHVFEVQTPDTKPGDYYVTAVDGGKFARLAGPFRDDHAMALFYVEICRRLCEDIDPRAHWWAYGTMRADHSDKPPFGRLNAQLGFAHDQSEPHAKPCAAPGLQSYRYAGTYGWVMIGARDDADAIAQAARSVTGPVDPSRLQKWGGLVYVPTNGN